MNHLVLPRAYDLSDNKELAKFLLDVWENSKGTTFAQKKLQTLVILRYLVSKDTIWSLYNFVIYLLGTVSFYRLFPWMRSSSPSHFVIVVLLCLFLIMVSEFIREYKRRKRNRKLNENI